MSLPFTYPMVLGPAAGLALLAFCSGLWAQGRSGLGVRVVGQRPWMLGLGLAFMLGGLGLGLAEPRWGAPESPRLTVHLVLDASRSMLVADVNGRSRWEAALALVDRTISKPAPGLRFGVDLLTGDAMPLVPPGEDRTLIRDALRAVKPGDIGSPGTSFGRGIPQILSEITDNTPEKSPEILMLVSDGEESWLSEEDALQRATAALKKAGIPLYAFHLGEAVPQMVPPASPDDPSEKPMPQASTANADFLRKLSEASGGRLLRADENPTDLFQKLAEGKAALPMSRSLIPAHPEWGAWIALIGLMIWLAAAGKPLVQWRPILLALFLLSASNQGHAGTQGTQDLPVSQGLSQALPQVLPQGVKAWLAQRALDQGDLRSAEKWRPRGRTPNHRLLAAEIDLRTLHPDAALKVLAPLTGQGAPRPLPAWRVPALLIAARANVALKQTEQAKALLEHLLMESPGREEAVHDLQSLLPDPQPPPPPNPKAPPPPRPSQGARPDELEGFQQRMPKKPKPQGGVKDI